MSLWAGVAYYQTNKGINKTPYPWSTSRHQQPTPEQDTNCLRTKQEKKGISVTLYTHASRSYLEKFQWWRPVKKYLSKKNMFWRTIIVTNVLCHINIKYDAMSQPVSLPYTTFFFTWHNHNVLLVIMFGYLWGTFPCITTLAATLACTWWRRSLVRAQHQRGSDPSWERERMFASLSRPTLSLGFGFISSEAHLHNKIKHLSSKLGCLKGYVVDSTAVILACL